MSSMAKIVLSIMGGIILTLVALMFVMFLGWVSWMWMPAFYVILIITTLFVVGGLSYVTYLLFLEDK